MDELPELRRAIDGVDRQILKAIQHRIAICRQIAETKRAQGHPIAQPTRVDAVLAKVRAFALDSGVSSALLEKIFESLIDECVRIQENLVNADDDVDHR